MGNVQKLMEIKMENQRQEGANYLKNQMHDVIDLNLKTLRNLSYFNPHDFLMPNKPYEFIEKNMDAFIKNGYSLLEYMENLYAITERNWLNSFSELKEKTENIERKVKRNVHQQNKSHELSSPRH